MIPLVAAKMTLTTWTVYTLDIVGTKVDESATGAQLSSFLFDLSHTSVVPSQLGMQQLVGCTDEREERVTGTGECQTLSICGQPISAACFLALSPLLLLLKSETTAK
ncbi:hypothetical protein RB195_010416 [Necator americanus]|uniref:Uncharacterized protein n=1 Tax=Necator americanus TaxID=51031 RepID=A0ABR1CXW8_NECAM